MALLVILPHFLTPYLISLIISILFWAYLGQCWNILAGFAGQLSFGHAAYFGIGAYTSTLLVVKLGLNPWIGMIIAGAAAMLFGLFTGYLCFRSGLRGVYFALATFAFAMSLNALAVNLDFVNKSMGIQMPLIGSDSWLRFQFETTRIPYYYIILGMVLVSIIVVQLIERNKLGYYFKAIREDQEAASMLGVNLMRYKMIAMAISSFMTGVAGTFYAQYFLFIDPFVTFGMFVNVQILIGPIIGGVGTALGPLVGASILTPLSRFTQAIIRQPPAFLPFLLVLKGLSGVDIMLYGILLIVVIIFMPYGVVGFIQTKWRQLRRHRGNYNTGEGALP
jgi:branched-chain amino acid transport system permease protein